MEILSYFIINENVIVVVKNTSREPHIYKVTNRETGQYYIGSQCSGKTVGVNYFTSSHNKEFKADFKTYGEEKYKIEVIKSFIDPEECVRVENYMIRDHMLLKDGLCLNRFYCCNGEKIFSRLGTHGWNKGIHLSEETRKKMSEAKKGTHHSEETLKKMREAQKGHPGWNKGIPHSEEARKKISLASPNRIKISIEGMVFDSRKDASKYYNVSDTTIRNWAQTNKYNTVYVEKCPKI